jgi:hypothetical protein
VLAAIQYDEIRAAIAAIVAPDTVFEIRCLGGSRKRVDAGYFNSPDAAATELSGLVETYQGIYITPNPLDPDLLARATNRIKRWSEFTTGDPNVTRRTWLLIDVDPKRPSGISSTNLEHNRAINKARAIAGMLEIEFGWCQPMLNSSGNGAHLMYPMNERNDDATRDTVQTFLKALAGRFNEPGLEVDTTVFNAARIWRLPGTWACKGDSTVERPHRKATILKQASEFELVSLSQLVEFINRYPPPDHKNGRPVAPTKANLEYLTQDKRFHFLNNIAMERLDQWVPTYFPGARQYQQGYRITSFELGRDKEEDLTIHPWPRGIKDFGVHDEGDSREGRRTPTMLIAEHHFNGDQEAAASALSATLKVPISEFDAISLPSEGNTGTADSYDKVFSASAAFDLTQIKSFQDLKGRKFKQLKWVVPGVIPAGCFILAARPKMRKTWLALQLLQAVATGGTFMQWKVNKGKALGLMLEDNERRIKSRIEKLHTFDMDLPDLTDFHYFTEGTFPRGQDGVDVIRRYLDDNPECTLVVIDTFAHFRAHDNNRDVYLKDYAAVMPLTRLASERDICIIVVHHEKKGLAGSQSGDFLEDVNGIKGRRGVQDETESRTLLITGRDVPTDFQLDMSFDAERGGWLPAARQDVRVAVKQLLTQYPFVSQTELQTFLPNVAVSRLRRVLIEMKYDGEIDQNRHGYSLKRNIAS